MSLATVGQDELMSCRGVTVVHGVGESAVRALAGVDLEIREGESVGLLGPSGSGKTTLLHVLGGLVPAGSGNVFWRGHELPTLDRAARHPERVKGIAFVFQGANLLANLDACENIAFAILAAGRLDRQRVERNGSGSRKRQTSS